MRLRRDDQLTDAQFAECADMIRVRRLCRCLPRALPRTGRAARAHAGRCLGVSARSAQCPFAPARLPAASRAAFMAAGLPRSREPQAAAPVDPVVAKESSPSSKPPVYGALRTRPVALFAILLILFISGIVISGSVTLAASALPGDPLYGVKTATEDVRLFLTPNEGIRSELRKEFGQRRIDEAHAVVEGRRPVDNLRLQGTIESFDAHQWVVSGLRVMLDASSQVTGRPSRRGRGRWTGACTG